MQDKIELLSLNESELMDKFDIRMIPVNLAVVQDKYNRILAEKKADKGFNFNYLPNFLSEEAKTRLAGLAIAAKMEISENKIFKGLVDGRIKKQLKEICLLDQTYVRAEDGKQTVAEYLKTVDKDLSLVKVVRFEVGEGITQMHHKGIHIIPGNPFTLCLSVHTDNALYRLPYPLILASLQLKDNLATLNSGFVALWDFYCLFHIFCISFPTSSHLLHPT